MNLVTDENILLKAMHAYDNAQLNTIDEFQQDFNRLACVQKLVERYLCSPTKAINLRLVLNHCIVLYNSFGNLVPDMFVCKFPARYRSVVRPMLDYLKILPPGAWADVGYDEYIHNLLREL